MGRWYRGEPWAGGFLRCRFAGRLPLLSRRRFMRYNLVLSMLLAAGCEGPAKKSAPAAAQRPSSAAAISNTDPCAMRLHDLCGPLLLYYATYHRLPARLEELSRMPGFENIRDFTCPLSGKPYLYNPVGIVNPDTPSRVVLYDPAPLHAKMRWAVSIIEPSDDSALVTKVIALPESYFSLHLTAPRP